MKVLILSSTCGAGGAAKAAINLTKELIKNDVDARMGVINKEQNLDFVFELPRKHYLPIERLYKKIISKGDKVIKKIIGYHFTTSNQILHTVDNETIIDVNWINKSDFDLVNLHWISGMISIKDIRKIKKPIVWTMHDTWLYCGAEHYPNVLENDIRYITGYYKNNKPETTNGVDLCRKVWEQKMKYLRPLNIHYVSPSNYEKEEASKSVLMRGKECSVIPNIISSDFIKYSTSLINGIKKNWGIPLNKKIIGFGAAYDIDNIHSVKGGYYLLEALKQLDPKKYFLVIFGPAGANITKALYIDYFAASYIQNEKILAMIYNICDVFVCPSIIENLSTTCLESLSCGVPAVAFNSGGTSDIVVHKKTGYLAKPFDSKDLVNGIEYCLNNRTDLSKNCIKKLKTDFNNENTLEKYITVYSDAIKV